MTVMLVRLADIMIVMVATTKAGLGQAEPIMAAFMAATVPVASLMMPGVMAAGVVLLQMKKVMIALFS